MRQEVHEKAMNALRVQHAYDLESQERKYEALLSDLRRQLAAAQERSARYEHNSALHTNMLGAVIATLERELAEAREEATTLRRQLDAIDQYADDCWRAGAAGLPILRWAQWIATRA